VSNRFIAATRDHIRFGFLVQFAGGVRIGHARQKTAHPTAHGDRQHQAHSGSVYELAIPINDDDDNNVLPYTNYRRVIFTYRFVGLNARAFRAADSLSVAILALQCVEHDHRNRNVKPLLKKPLATLKDLQQPDGGFGSLHTTALAIRVS